MEPELFEGDDVIVTNNIQDVRLGDWLVFWYDDPHRLIVHQLTFIDYHPKTMTHYGMWGLNNPRWAVEWIHKDQVVGKVIRK